MKVLTNQEAKLLADYICYLEKRCEVEGYDISTRFAKVSKAFDKLIEKTVSKSPLSKIAKANDVSEEYVANNIREFVQDL